MCGISLIISQSSFYGIEIQKMTDVIHHRGPDGEGFVLVDLEDKIVTGGGQSTSSNVWMEETPYQPIHDINDFILKTYRIAIGHRRLAIVDLSAFGHLPMSYADKRFWITYNGEIYNYFELRLELESIGYTFYSQTDTEVILAAYHEWGVECQQKFNGMWSFVIYDYELDEIFVSRDRFGIKPLYYWFSPDGNFCVASEIKQFTTLTGWEAKINPQRVYDYLVYSYTDHTDETMFLGVYQIPGGCYFKANCKSIKQEVSGKVKWVKWYRLEEKGFQGTFEEATIEFERLFKKAVNLQLRADVLVGSTLSGGIDSSAIVCQSANVLKKQNTEDLFKTFSSCSMDSRFDEKKWMNHVINHVAVDSHFVYPKLEDLFKLTSQIIWNHDEPYQSQSVFLGFHVFELAKQNQVKVILNGQGADEYLGGYNQFSSARCIEMIRRLKWIKLWNELKNSRQYSKCKLRKIVFNFLVSVLPIRLRKAIVKNFGSYKEVINLINSNVLSAIQINPNDSIQEKLDSVKSVSKHLLFYSTLPKYLKWEDRNSMAHSVEARVPFLDHRLVEFCYNLPSDYLELNGQTKRVQRESLKGILPDEIYNRKDKMGFITPEEKWVREDNPKMFRNKIVEAIAISKGIIKPEALSYFDRIVSGEIPFDYTYCRIILFAEWINCFKINLMREDI